MCKTIKISYLYNFREIEGSGNLDPEIKFCKKKLAVTIGEIINYILHIFKY